MALNRDVHFIMLRLKGPGLLVLVENLKINKQCTSNIYIFQTSQVSWSK